MRQLCVEVCMPMDGVRDIIDAAASIPHLLPLIEALNKHYAPLLHAEVTSRRCEMFECKSVAGVV
jgi:hypothetical protein